jgi:hypothetical protein
MMNLTGIHFALGLVVAWGGQAGQGQQSEADRKAVAELRAKAERSDVRAQVQLGDACLLGKLGLVTNASEAVGWYPGQRGSSRHRT